MTVRLLTTPEEIRSALDMQDAVFGGTPRADTALPDLLSRQGAGSLVEVWGAEVDGRMVSAGRIEVVAGTSFAGIWGGATLPEFRRRGIYRALSPALRCR